MRNKFPGACRECGVPVAAQAGYFERAYGRWWVRCMLCTAKAKNERGAPLTPPQAEALRGQS